MRDRLLFSYMIDDIKVDVYHLEFPKRYSFINKEFYNGLTAAIAEYLYYPYEIIAPRAYYFPIEFVYNNEELEEIILIAEEYIAECTKEAFLNYMEESREHADSILPEYIVTPDLNDENVLKWCNALKEKSEITSAKIHNFKIKIKGLSWVKFSYETGIFYGRYREKIHNIFLCHYRDIILNGMIFLHILTGNTTFFSFHRWDITPLMGLTKGKK